MAYEGGLSIQALQSAYASGSLTPSSLVSALQSKIVSYLTSNPHVWIDVESLEKLQARAQELEKMYEGKEKPSLYGIPFSAKNNIEVKGLKTTAGCEKFTYYPEETAEVVRRCMEAGAILIGTTNLEQFATGLTGCRSPFGTPLCHQDPSFCAGGSSSGSAVSVAAQLVTFSLGTDTAGSIRVPAALNGVVGLKPTFGRVSKRGVVPAVKTLDCVGVLSKSAEDAKVVWEVIKGYDERDVYSRKDQLFDRIARWERTQNLRIGLPPSGLMEKLSKEYGKCWGEVVSTLPEKGFIASSRFSYEPFEEANELVYGSSLVAQRFASFAPFVEKHGTDSLHPVIRSILDNTPRYTAIEAFNDLNRVAELKRQVELEFRNNIDVLIVPSTAKHYRTNEVEADPHGTNRVLGTFSQFVNLLDLCAISVPAGTWSNEEGNPMSFGITLIAEAGRDEDLLELAQRFVWNTGLL